MSDTGAPAANAGLQVNSGVSNATTSTHDVEVATPEPPKPARAAATPKPPVARKISAALQRAVQGAGEAWAVDSANALRVEGRQVTGGWPGTITEARQRVRTCALVLGSSMNSEDLEVLTRLAYETAKKVWLARSERVNDD